MPDRAYFKNLPQVATDSSDDPPDSNRKLFRL